MDHYETPACCTCSTSNNPPCEYCTRDADEDHPEDDAVKQPYMLPSCQLDRQLIVILLTSKECPCDGCNMDRNKCKGTPKKDRTF